MLKEKYPSTEDTRLILQNNLKAIREILNWTSSDLGNLIGVTKQTISKTPLYCITYRNRF